MAEQMRADPEKTFTVEIKERTTKKRAKSLPGTSEEALDTVSAWEESSGSKKLVKLISEA
jgi:hypothetical protein